jgi:nitrite reductase (NO-forming)
MFWRAPFLFVVVAAACGKPAPQVVKGPPAASADTLLTRQPPTAISHGEAPIGPPMTAPDRAADAPAPDPQHHRKLRFVTAHVHHQVAPGVVYDAWTFDSIVPGPTIRLRVGDTLDFTLVNGAKIPHSMDFHAAEIAPDRAYRNVMPGDSIQFRFVPRVPGVFM